MINKTEDFKTYEQIIEYEDGDCWDFIGYKNDVPFNEIIAQGLNFKKTIIEQDRDDWLCHIEHSQVIYQDKEKTVMYSRLLTNYYTHFVNTHKFELDCDNYITIYHNKPLSEIKKEYKNEIKLLNQLQSILQTKGYQKPVYKCDCDYCCDCLSHKRLDYRVLTMQQTFNNHQTIGEAKDIFNNDYDFTKEFVKQFFKAETTQSLYFTDNGAIGEIEIKQYIK